MLIKRKVFILSYLNFKKAPTPYLTHLVSESLRGSVSISIGGSRRKTARTIYQPLLFTPLLLNQPPPVKSQILSACTTSPPSLVPSSSTTLNIRYLNPPIRPTRSRPSSRFHNSVALLSPERSWRVLGTCASSPSQVRAGSDLDRDHLKNEGESNRCRHGAIPRLGPLRDAQRVGIGGQDSPPRLKTRCDERELL